MKKKRKYNTITIIQAIAVTALFHVMFFVLFSPMNKEVLKKTERNHQYVMSLDIANLPAQEQVLLKRYLKYNNPLDMIQSADISSISTQNLTAKFSKPEEIKIKNIHITNSFDYAKYTPLKSNPKEIKKSLITKFTPLALKNLTTDKPNSYNSNAKITAGKYFISDAYGSGLLLDTAVNNNFALLMKQNNISKSIYPTKIFIKKSEVGFQPQIKILTKCGKQILDIAAFKVATAHAEKILTSTNKKQIIIYFNWALLIKEVAK